MRVDSLQVAMHSVTSKADSDSPSVSSLAYDDTLDVIPRTPVGLRPTEVQHRDWTASESTGSLPATARPRPRPSPSRPRAACATASGTVGQRQMATVGLSGSYENQLDCSLMSRRPRPLPVVSSLLPVPVWCQCLCSQLGAHDRRRETPTRIRAGSLMMQPDSDSSSESDSVRT